MELITSPLSPQRKKEWLVFLETHHLKPDPHLKKTVCLLNDSDHIIATASIEHNIIKDVLIDPAYQHQGLAATLFSTLYDYAAQHNQTPLMLYTKPQNRVLFEGLGFYEIATTSEAMLMENQPHGIQRYLARLPQHKGNNGIIIANCNPITLGHLHLIEQAAQRCDHCYVLIVEEDRSLFPFSIRKRLVQEATRSLKHISIASTGPYQISAATFPDYFLKEHQNKHSVQVALDLEIFLRWIVPALNIRYRFVGTEPLDPLTAAYNEAMKQAFKNTTVELIEMERYSKAGQVISATQIRKKLEENNLDQIKDDVPACVMEFLESEDAKLLKRKNENE